MVDIGTGISTVQAALDCVKGIISFIKAIKDIDKNFDSIDLQRQLVNLEHSLIKTKEEINSLLRENQSLRQQLQLKEELRLDDDTKALWRINGNGQKEGPFCSTCFEVNKYLIPLHRGKHQSFNCPKCHTHFQAEKGRSDFEEEIKNLERGQFRFF